MNMNVPVRTICVLLVISSSLALTSLSASEFTESLRPLFAKHCFQCHGPDHQEADLRLDDLDPDMLRGKHGGQWQEVLDALNRGDMPPEDELQPTPRERRKMIDWMTGELRRAAESRRSTGGQVTLRRLTKYEYQNTMRDLLGIDMDYSRELPPDTKGIDGYKNNGVYMSISDLQLDEYYTAARRGLAAAIIEGDAPKPVQIKVTKSATGVRFDRLVTAAYDTNADGTVVGYAVKDSKKKNKKPSAAKKSAMVLLCLDRLPKIGAFRVRIEASSIPGDPQFSPPNMLVRVGHKTGVAIEPSKTLGQHDVTASHDARQTFTFTGRLEEFPLHTGKTTKKFPGLRVIITDESAVPPPAPPKVKKGEPVPPVVVENRPQLVIHSVEFETPVDPSWPPASHSRILPPRDSHVSENDYVREVLHPFMARAFRRPPTEQEVSWAAKYYQKLRPSVHSMEEAMRETLALVLVSPKFLYLPEYQRRGTDDESVALTDFQLATRLAYFLWGTMPDDELFDLARQNKLNDSAVLAAQVERMLADRRSQQFVEGFAGQWLNLDGVDAVAVNPEYFPKFDNSLKEDMKQESLRFFAEILYNNRSCLEFIDSDFIVINDRLAEFYGIEKPKSGEFVAVPLQHGSLRGGVLTQASFLLAGSTGAHGHPIYRAKWMLDRMLGEPPGDPPADVPELDEQQAGSKQLTISGQLEEHRKREACNRCHRRLDPWGIPFEEFNALGQHDADLVAPGKNKQSATRNETVLPDGTKINGSQELIGYLLQNKKQQFARGFTKHLLTYALGRSLQWTDRPTIETLSEAFAASGYRMDRLITMIVQNDAFRTK